MCRMERQCIRCGKLFAAKRSTARYCAKDCSTRACLERQSGARVVSPTIPSDLVAPAVRPLIYESAVVEFDLAGVSLSTSAVQALSVAVLLDSPATADGAKSGLSREFSRLRAEALSGVPVGDELDVLRARVRARHAGLID
jgi:hypothetical protein